jgi:hypothetical protein
LLSGLLDAFLGQARVEFQCHVVAFHAQTGALSAVLRWCSTKGSPPRGRDCCGQP